MTTRHGCKGLIQGRPCPKLPHAASGLCYDHGGTPRSIPDWFPALVEAVGKTYRLPPSLILSPLREARVVRARDALIWCLRDGGLSLPHIGYLVERDHSTVLSALRRLEANQSQHIVAVALSLGHVPQGVNA